jgi:3'(2'), 5'-bisphosphate nucleotidase
VGLKLAIIAAGERDLYVNPTSHCSSWDTCAPEAILAEAGGRLSDIHGEPLRYDTESVGHDRGLLASNGLLHDAAVAKLAPLFPH